MTRTATQTSEDESQYRIEATGAFREPRSRILKHGDTFAVFNQFGDIAGDRGSPDGLYHDDTRHLSRLELRLNGDRPLLLSANPGEDSSLLTVDLANPDTVDASGTALHRELIYLNRRQFVWQDAYNELLLVRNFDLEAHAITIGVAFAADFVDVFEVRGQRRARRGKYSTERLSSDTVVLRYCGLDGVERDTTLRFEPAPARLDTAGAEFHLKLNGGEGTRIVLRIFCGAPAKDGWGIRRYYRALRSSRHASREASGRAASLEGSNAVFNELARRSTADLYMLMTNTPQGPYPYAGIPWFSTVFGRDGIITALLTLWADPTIAKGVLSFLAAEQATSVDPERDAEPGKILHEMRRGEMARLGEVPFARYYGSVDATPLFVMLAGAYAMRTGDFDTIRELWPNIKAALQWLDKYGDRDRDGFVEYDRQSSAGLANQGWKDSGDAIFHADGALAEGPIALCEVQGYVYAAKRHAAHLARALGDDKMATQFDDAAEKLRHRFEAAFWCEDLSTYAVALDGAKRPCRVITSNAGHTLLTGIASPEHASRVADTLFRVGSFSGWGIRTVDMSAVRYNPISYHNGSVWPHDNAMIALGLARYGFQEPVLQILTGMFNAASYWEPRRLPELFCGFARRRTGPTMYPVACSPQAWASAAVFALVQASLGLQFDPGAREIHFEHPMLPNFLDHLHVRGLKLGTAEADVLLHRSGEEVAATVTRRSGTVRIVIVH
ncbi:MAG: amylo-alpha-1,6-glucosidase [Alphaproteobacteria bacterium]|nr:amylo-alpha-1,6-glucosidase [Alphaproteobacteria bacterium]